LEGKFRNPGLISHQPRKCNFFFPLTPLRQKRKKERKKKKKRLAMGPPSLPRVVTTQRGRMPRGGAGVRPVCLS